jgi:O-antigen ligase
MNYVYLDKFYQYLLIVLAFLLPLTVSGANIIIFIISILWLFSGDYRFKYNHIISSKLMISSIIFYLIHVVGMLWTEDYMWGFHVLHKMWYFILFFPILFNIVKKKYIVHYISAFLFAISLTEVLSYLVWFELIPPIKNATVENPTPFMSHISYNPILTVAIYLVLYQIFFNTNLNKLRFFMYSFFAISMTINMFITGGRAGQIMFFSMLAILIFQFFEKSKFKSLLGILLIIPIIFITAYQASPLFEKRVNLAFHEALTFEVEKVTKVSSVGMRINYALNSWHIIKENPIIGVGTGDFPSEYKKVNELNSPHIYNVTNPHNMYTLVMVQLGLIGLISMLSIFYYQIKFALNSSDKFFKNTGLALPLLFLVIMWSDSYLLGHYTTLLFIFLSSFLYKDFETS